MSPAAPHIGTLREKPLHAALKRWYAGSGDHVEVPVDGFVIDIVRNDLLIEIQTRGFSSMKQKVDRLLSLGHHLRIVHPIATDRWIVKLDDDDEVVSRRLSPRHGRPTDIFGELVSFPGLMAHPGLELEVVLTKEDEYRRHTSNRAWRRMGWTVVERRLIDVVESVRLGSVGDLVRLLPANLPDVFDTADVAAALKRPRRDAQQLTYCLRQCGGIFIVGKQGNAIQYQVAQLEG